MDSQLLTMLRKAAAAQGGTGFALRFTGLSLLCAALFGVLLTPLAKTQAPNAAVPEIIEAGQSNQTTILQGSLEQGHGTENTKLVELTEDVNKL